ncbi:DNA-binding transcriptional MerR regulator [Endobacter medicaginis]|jgi:DNA-binding transcriptional MerR regulator|uniref:DNA-binding transcriptional MerR regulator n=1 Tax=Endobacter medicaginis TaxID=1181271 RepID=A0A850NM21_9PROT|nr:MerR family DNA-binding transcriptional regulator [Endobacter medicaginis]MBB3174669.1 DNA-binding transcriptional MerR regulator [Endobacter medicaginis]MCX5474936.1 MerR family DNA-binding transcriptional regulator [Endobacter medicaginis]NVN28946.1 MerR family DNA-binding transcriptional regulator [Endobacter medicaginis]
MAQHPAPSSESSGTDVSPPVSSHWARADQKARAAGEEGRLYSVTELATELKVTARTLRFYEDKGLISPSRAGAARVYTPRERARMLLILRGKRLGFSLRDIGSFLDLYDADERHLRQKEVLLQKIDSRVAQLAQMRRALDITLGELEAMAAETRAVIAEMQSGGQDAHRAADASAEVTRRLAREGRRGRD